MRSILSALALIALAPARPTTDVSLAVIEYRVLRSVGEVRLTTRFVHDPQLQQRMLEDLTSFDRDGMILIAGNRPRRVVRTETIDSHSLQISISISPPLGHGYRGGLATADVTVIVDGKKRIDSPYDEGAVELADIAILPDKGTISVDGSLDNKHFAGSLDLAGNETIDKAWLERKVTSATISSGRRASDWHKPRVVVKPTRSTRHRRGLPNGRLSRSSGEARRDVCVRSEPECSWRARPLDN